MVRKQISDHAIILTFLREGLGWTQARLERDAGLAANMVGDYENGHKQLTRERLEQLVAVLGLGPERIDACLEELEAARSSSRPGPPDPFSSRRKRIDSIAGQFGRMAAGFARSALSLLTLGSESVHAHDQGDWLWRRLRRHPPGERMIVVEEDRRYRKWGLVLLVVQASLDAAPNRPKEALELARLGVRIAELVAGSREWRWRIQGYAGAALINAYRVCSDLPSARKARVKARQLWEDGEAGDPGLLNEALLPWIEAALHRAEREFALALKRIDEALELDNGELRGKILLTKAYIHHTLDEPEASTATILKAIPFIDTEKEPRLAWVVLHNLIADLLYLGRAEEAKQRLPDARRLAESLGGELDLARVLWVEAMVADALGQLREARKRFEQARNAFTRPELSYDHALVSMELSIVLLRQGDALRVRSLSEETLRIFRSQSVHSQALIALQVFSEAARRDIATVELARRVVRYLYRAKDDPELKFEAGAE